jgi:ubiquinone/menaquinone biosynthesis C-methylase UbiE
MTTFHDHEEVRESVSQAYAKAVTGESRGCCGASPEQKGVAAKMAGYSREELESLPADAVVNSFGCGNPLAFSGVREGDVVVDLGSGAGIDLLIAAKKVGPAGRVIGVDMTDEMIARARANITAGKVANAEVRKGIIEALPVDSGSVDWVISNCVINLSPEKPRVFAEIARVLKPGGRMRVSDIMVEDLPESVRQSKELYCSCVAGAIREEDYLAGLRASGLADVEVLERVVYDEAQLKAFMESELADTDGGTSCCGGAGERKLDSGVLESMKGKLWSAIVVARKPGE